MRRVVSALVASGASRELASSVPKVTRPSPRHRTATPDELALLLLHANPWMRLLLLLVHDAALPATAALAVHASDVNPDGDIVSRGKGGQITTVPASGRIRQILAMCPPGDTPCVQLLHGHTVSYEYARSQFNLLRIRAGVASLTLHDLRRTMAESTYRITGDLRAVQQLLGHGSLSTTNYYLQRPASPATRATLAAVQAEVCVDSKE